MESNILFVVHFATKSVDYAKFLCIILIRRVMVMARTASYSIIRKIISDYVLGIEVLPH